MRRVPRHEFVPEQWREEAYADHPLPIGEAQTISQPYIVALMTSWPRSDRAPACSRSHRLGYQAAVLAELGAEVHNDRDRRAACPEGPRHARAPRVRRIHVRQGMAIRGWPEAAPFTAIVGHRRAT